MLKLKKKKVMNCHHLKTHSIIFKNEGQNRVQLGDSMPHYQHPFRFVKISSGWETNSQNTL